MPTKVTIVRASNAFIYLPLHLAESYSLFSMVQGWRNPLVRWVARPDFEFVSKRSEVAGDRNAIDEMIDLTERGQLAFALGDPLEITESKADASELVVLGAIVKRPPFWVVNGQEAKSIDDLNIDNIVFYDRETLQTGHYLGRYIADRKKLKGYARFPVVTEVGRELDFLIEKKRDGLTKCGAVTVDLLGMARAIHRNGLEQCKPVLPIFDQPEFQNFVTSAFITHRRVLKDGTRVAQVLIEAMKKAVEMVHELPIAAKLCRAQSAKKDFREQLKLKHEERQPKQLTVAESLWVARKIIEDRLYLTDFTISLADWERAAKSDRWTGSRPDDVVGLYDEVVKPGNELAHFRGTERFSNGIGPLPDRISDGAAVEQVGVDSEVELLLGLKTFDVQGAVVVGNYRRFDEKTRNTLKIRVREICRGLNVNTTVHENFLIWAAPGSGKTYFVEQIADSLGPRVRSFPINFSNISRGDLQSTLAQVSAAEGPTLVLFDEIDARAEEAWLYVEAFSALDANLSKDRQAVFVLVGSMPGGIAKMVDSMKARAKGGDLLNRVPDYNHFSISELTPGDQIAVIASQLETAGTSRGQKIEEVEKSALYFILKNADYKSARKLSDFVGSAALRIGASKRLDYDDLFSRGVLEGKQFWTRNEKAMLALANTYVKLV